MCKAIHFALASVLVLAGCGSKSSSSTLGTGGSTSSSANGGSGGGGCGMAFINIDGDGPTNRFDAACMGSYGALYTAHANGYLGYLTHNSSDLQLFVDGCAESTAPPMDGSLSLTVPQMGSTTATMGTASYANGTDTFTTTTAVTLMVSQMDNATVQGSYTATVSSTNNGTKMLSGTFSVCRVPNYLPP
jgi:hypothetical protein